MSNVNGIAVQEYQSRFGEAPGFRELATEKQRWQQICQELAEELGRTREDCERYRRMVQKLLPMDVNQEVPDLSAEQVRELMTKGQTFDRLIQAAFPD